MTRFSISALASVSVLALGLIAAPATIDLTDDLIGAKSAWAKGGNGGGNGGGHGGGHGHGRDKADKSAGSEVSSTDVDSDEVEGEDDEGEETPTAKSLPESAIAGKTNSKAYHSANYGLDTVNANSAVAYSKEDEPTGEDPTGEEPTGEEPTGEEPTGEEPTGEEPVVEGEDPATGDQTSSS